MCDCYEASKRKLIPKRSYKHPSVFKFCELNYDYKIWKYFDEDCKICQNNYERCVI